MTRIAHQTHVLALALTMTAGLALAACGQPTEAPAPPRAEPPTSAAMPIEAPTEAMMATDDILVVLTDDGRFETLVKLIARAGLTDTLKGPGPYTFFAPTDDAFTELPAGTLDALTPEQVGEILLYHVVNGQVMAADGMAMSGQPVTMMGTGAYTATLKSDGANLMINDATVTVGDILALNGVIHVIDKVLMHAAPSAEAGMGESDMAETPEATAEGGAAGAGTDSGEATAMPEASATP